MLQGALAADSAVRHPPARTLHLLEVITALSLLQAAHADPADEVQHKADEAATKVQAAFRGHQARKQVANMRAEAAPS
jgi:hypothetical protein